MSAEYAAGVSVRRAQMRGVKAIMRGQSAAAELSLLGSPLRT